MTVFDPLSTTEEQILRRHISYSNLPLTFTDMNSKTNQLSQKSHQWSNDDLHWLHCELFQDFHHFGRLKFGQILAGPHMTFHPLWNVNTTRKLESYFKAPSLKASWSIKTVSAADFPNRKWNSMHTLCSLLSAIIKIAKLPSRHLEKKPQQQ